MTLRIGLLGASRIAPVAVIAPTRDRQDVKVVAVAARDPARARSFAAEYDIPSVHKSYSELLANPEVDLVYNGLPPAFHLSWTLAALPAGKHVLLEKPSAMTALETSKMVAAAAEAGRRLIEAFHYRYHPMFARILELAGNGHLGTLRQATAIFEAPVPETPGEIRWDLKLGGGALMDLGCYPVHWLRTIAGSEPSVRAVTRDVDARGVDISTRAELSFSGGLEASLSCSMRPASGQPMASLTLEGSEGRLTALNPLAPQFGNVLTWASRGAPEVHETFEKRPTYAYQLDAIVHAIQTGAALPTESGDMIATMRVIDALRDFKSAKT